MKEQFIQDNTGNFTKLFEIAPNPIFIADRQGVYRYVNAAACKFLGYAFDELVGRNIADIIQPAEAERFTRFKENAFSGAEEIGDWEFVCRDGTFVWGEVHSRLLDENFLVAFVYDISKNRRAEEKIRH